jgi:hypothetical protein
MSEYQYRDEVNSILKQLLEDKGQQAERSIKNQFASWRRGLQTGDTDTSRRTVGELWQNAAKARQIRLEKQKRDRKQREIKRRKEREAYLKNLSNNQDVQFIIDGVKRLLHQAVTCYDINCNKL